MKCKRDCLTKQPFLVKIVHFLFSKLKYFSFPVLFRKQVHMLEGSVCKKHNSPELVSLWRLNLKRYKLHLPQGYLWFNIRLEELFWMAMFSIRLDLHTQCSSGAKFFPTPTGENTYCLPAFPSASNFETEIKKRNLGGMLFYERGRYFLYKRSLHTATAEFTASV